MSRKLAAITLALLVLIPILLALSLSLFPRADYFSVPARILPSTLDISGYRKAFGLEKLFTYIANSLVVSFSTAGLRTALSFLTAFSFSFLHFKGRNLLLFLMVTSAFIPQDSILYEMYIVTSRLGLKDSYMGLILPSAFSAMQALMLLTFFKGMDKDSLEAAKMDGAGDYTIMTRILLPLSRSITLTIFLQSFISSFNAYLWPLLVTNSEERRTIQIGISLLGFGESGDKSALFASLVIITLPFIVLVLSTRKLMIKALQDGLSN